jgi:pyruvate,orthophosphate dikinase
VVGCSELKVDQDARRARLADATLAEGDWITIEGDAGQIYLGRCQTTESRPEAELAEIAAWQSQAGDRRSARAAAAQ